MHKNPWVNKYAPILDLAVALGKFGRNKKFACDFAS